MRNNIVPILSCYKRKLYVEPFGGACGLLFGKEPEIEVYNDANQSLVNLFRVLRNPKQAQEIERLCNITPVSRVYFNELRKLVYEFQNGRSTIALQNELGLKCAPKMAIAFAFFYVMNTTFRGNVANLSYGGGKRTGKEIPFKTRTIEGSIRYRNSANACAPWRLRISIIATA